MRLALAFLRRDATIELSYKTSFIVQILGSLVLLIIFYYLGALMKPEDVPALQRYGGSYLAFLLIGVALTDCVSVSLTTFAKQIREGQLTGALEVTLLCPVSLRRILLYSALWPYTFSMCRFSLYLVFGTAMYGVGLAQANLPAALIIFLLTVSSFAGLGMIWASVVLLIKRGEAIMTVMSYVLILLSGTLFPKELLPRWVGHVADLIPLTYGLDGMRLALLQGHSIPQLWNTILIMIVFSVGLIGAGTALFATSVRIAKHTGTLSQY